MAKPVTPRAQADQSTQPLCNVGLVVPALGACDSPVSNFSRGTASGAADELKDAVESPFTLTVSAIDSVRNTVQNPECIANQMLCGGTPDQGLQATIEHYTQGTTAQNLGRGIVGLLFAGLTGGEGAEGDLLTAAKPVTGGIGPVLKGQAGVRASIDEAIGAGERLRGTEVTVQAANSGRRVRLDYLTEVDGRLVATEVKTGPYARLSTRQREIFEELEQFGGTFVGGNAERFGLRGRFPARPIRRDFRP